MDKTIATGEFRRETVDKYAVSVDIWRRILWIIPSGSNVRLHQTVDNWRKTVDKRLVDVENPSYWLHFIEYNGGAKHSTVLRESGNLTGWWVALKVSLSDRIIIEAAGLDVRSRACVMAK